MTFSLLSPDAVLDVPVEVAVCPYCGAKLTVQFEAWEETEDGSWIASGFNLECTAEPELTEDGESTTDAWDEWLNWHTQMPYVYWLPCEQFVADWVNKRYRFKVGRATEGKQMIKAIDESKPIATCVGCGKQVNAKPTKDGSGVKTPMRWPRWLRGCSAPIARSSATSCAACECKSLDSAIATSGKWRPCGKR